MVVTPGGVLTNAPVPSLEIDIVKSDGTVLLMNKLTAVTDTPGSRIDVSLGLLRFSQKATTATELLQIVMLVFGSGVSVTSGDSNAGTVPAGHDTGAAAVGAA